MMSMKVSSPAGAGPLARRYPRGAAGLLLRSPTPTCHRPSATAAPWDSSSSPSDASTTTRKTLRAPAVGTALRSGGDLRPSSDPSGGDPSGPGTHRHGGGRGWGQEWVRHGYIQQERARRWSEGRGRGWGSDGCGRPAITGPPAAAEVELHAPSAINASGSSLSRVRATDNTGGVRPYGGGGGYVRLSELRHLGELQEAVGQLANRWAAREDFGTLVAAFSFTCKVRAMPRATFASLLWKVYSGCG